MMSIAFIVLLVLVVIGAAAASRRRRAPNAVAESYLTPIEYGPPGLGALPAEFDVCAVRIAIDGRASAFVQTELDAIMKAHDRTSEDDRARCLREITIMLRRVRDSWVYGGGANEPTRPRQDALVAYARLVDDARTRLHTPTTQISSATSHTSLILVSIVVATRGELLTLSAAATGEDLRRALEAAIHRPGSDLIGFDVVWEPRQSGATVSSIAIEGAYAPAELHPLQGVDGSKAHCTYCRGPFPAELVTCPHCGAPAREARSPR